MAGGTKEIGEVVQRVVDKVDPFTETDDPVIMYMMERYGFDGEGPLYIEGRIESFTTSYTTKRTGEPDRGRSEYDHDMLTTWARYLPDDLRCDIVINKAGALIREGGHLAVVQEVFRRLGRMTGQTTHDLLVQYQDQVYQEVGKKRRGRVEATKEVRPITKPSTIL